MPIRSVVVIGTGTMGPGIAEMFALAGFRTVLCGRSQTSVESGLVRARLAGANLVRFGLTDEGRAAKAEPRLSGSTDPEAAAAEADFVAEAVVENVEIKKHWFARIDRAAPAGTILATNTSGLSITEIAAATERPDRVAGMHWWNPPHLVPLVEVVRGARTSDETAAHVAALARALGKLPVTVNKDVPGFIGNRLQYALLREAAHLVEEGIASPEDVDLAMRAGPGLRYAALGPLEAADFIGLDVVNDVMDYLLPALDAASRTPPAIAEKVQAGRLGSKTGNGFYQYTNRSQEDVLTERDAKLARLLAAGFGR